MESMAPGPRCRSIVFLREWPRARDPAEALPPLRDVNGQDLSSSRFPPRPVLSSRTSPERRAGARPPAMIAAIRTGSAPNKDLPPSHAHARRRQSILLEAANKRHEEGNEDRSIGPASRLGSSGNDAAQCPRRPFEAPDLHRFGCPAHRIIIFMSVVLKTTENLWWNGVPISWLRLVILFCE